MTLDCTVLAGTPPVSYSWTANGVEVSQNPTLLISESSNYTCRASNLDNPNVLEASILFCEFTLIHFTIVLCVCARSYSTIL